MYKFITLPPHFIWSHTIYFPIFYRALARTCDSPINDKKGEKAKDWKNSKPVRVVRNYKGKKTSEYAPEEGNRYDGIYKVVKYWPEKNKNGFIVWKYLFKRDDTVRGCVCVGGGGGHFELP